jgi:hypothetical protein
MNNPNEMPNEPQDGYMAAPTEVEGTAPRSYIAAGVVATLLIALLCIIGVVILSTGVFNARPSPTVAPDSLTKINVVGGIPTSGPFALHGENFVPNERVEIYVAFTAGATFDQFAKIGEAQAGTDGSFSITGLNLPTNPDNHGTVYVLARGESSGFSPVVPVTIGGTAEPSATTTLSSSATVTLPPGTASPTPQEPTFTPTPVTPTNPPTATSTPDPNALGIWFGRYYDNPDLDGEPVFTRSDANLNFNWRSGSPRGDIPNDNFSVTWTRNETFKTTDNYIFTLTVDDGARVYVDNQLIINEWHNGGARTVTVGYAITKGQHQLRVDYYEATGNAQISLSWAVGYTGWVGRYYNSSDFSGALILKRDDPNIDFDWGFGSPAPEVNPDNFSVDWQRTVRFDVAGTYVFTAEVDDRVRLIIDGNPSYVFDNFDTSGSRTSVGTRALSAGNHTLELQYAELTGEAKIKLTWAQVIVPPTTTYTPSPMPPTHTPLPPSPTWTSSPIPPPSDTPVPTHTPTETGTPTETPTGTEIPSPTPT